jgi:hypothetical protein
LIGDHGVDDDSDSDGDGDGNWNVVNYISANEPPSFCQISGVMSLLRLRA